MNLRDIEGTKGPVGETLAEAFGRLFERWGPQGWWPADSADEVCIGAVLTQNTNWANVTRAMENLKRAGVTDLASIHLCDQGYLAQLIRPAGYYNIKAGRLKNLARLVCHELEEGLETLFGMPLDDARQRLLETKGIGPETADSILLYAGGLPTFVVDAYTGRILKRHDIITGEEDYHEVRALFMDALPHDPKLFNEFHALLVRAGKEHCKAPGPACLDCPLEDL